MTDKSQYIPLSIGFDNYWQIFTSFFFFWTSFSPFYDESVSFVGKIWLFDLSLNIIDDCQANFSSW